MSAEFEHDKGIVLSVMSRGERDVVVQFFGERSGKISLVARGAKDRKAKLAGFIMPGAMGTFAWVQGQTARTIVSADSRNILPFVKIVESRVAALSALGLVENVVPFRGASPEILPLVSDFFNCIVALHQPSLAQSALMLFAIKLLAVLGWFSSGDARVATALGPSAHVFLAGALQKNISQSVPLPEPLLHADALKTLVEKIIIWETGNPFSLYDYTHC